MTDLKRGYIVGDKVFKTKAEAEEHLREPVVLEALTTLASDDADSAKWLLENRDLIIATYRAGKIRRVSKAERKMLVTALEEITEGFLFDHRAAVISSFRWPTVERGTDEAEATKTAFMEVCEDNEPLADWLIDNKDALIEAYNTGKPKREVSEKAKEGLAKFQAKRKAEKEARLKAEAEAAEKEEKK